MPQFSEQWVTFGNHRIRLSCSDGFPSHNMVTAAAIAATLVSNNSQQARVLEVWCNDRQRMVGVTIGTTELEDSALEPKVEDVLNTVFGESCFICSVTLVPPGDEAARWYNHARHLAEQLKLIPRREA